MMILAMALAAGPVDTPADQAPCVARHMTTPAAESARWLLAGAKSETPADKATGAAFSAAIAACVAQYHWSRSQGELGVAYASASFLYDTTVAPLSKSGISEAELSGYVATMDAAARARVKTDKMLPGDVSAMVDFAQRAGAGATAFDGAPGQQFGMYLGEAIVALVTMEDARKALAGG